MLENWKIIVGITFIAIGIILNQVTGHSFGTVMLGVGGLFFISGMADIRKRNEHG